MAWFKRKHRSGRNDDGGTGAGSGAGRERSLTDLLPSTSDQESIATLLRGKECDKLRLVAPKGVKDDALPPDSFGVIMVTNGNDIDWDDKRASQFLQLVNKSDANVHTIITPEMRDAGRIVIIPDAKTMDAVAYECKAFNLFEAVWAVATIRQRGADDLESTTVVEIRPTDVEATVDAALDVLDEADTMYNIIAKDTAWHDSMANEAAAPEDGGSSTGGMPKPRTAAPITPAATADPSSEPDASEQARHDAQEREAQAQREEQARQDRAALEARVAARQAQAAQQAAMQQQTTTQQQTATQQAPAQPTMQTPTPQAPPQVPSPRQAAVQQRPAPQQQAAQQATQQAAQQATQQAASSDEDFDPAAADQALAPQKNVISSALERTIKDDQVRLTYSVNALEPLFNRVDETLIPMKGIDLDGHTTWLREQTDSLIQEANAKFRSMVRSDKENIQRFFIQACERLARNAMDMVRIDGPSAVKDKDGHPVNADLMKQYGLINEVIEQRHEAKGEEVERRVQQLRDDFDEQRKRAGEAARISAENDFITRSRPDLDQRINDMDGVIETEIITERDSRLADLTKVRQRRAEQQFTMVCSKLLVRLGDTRKQQSDMEGRYATKLTDEIKDHLLAQDGLESVQKDILANDRRLEEAQTAHKDELARLHQQYDAQLAKLQSDMAKDKAAFDREQDQLRTSMQLRIDKAANESSVLRNQLARAQDERDQARTEAAAVKATEADKYHKKIRKQGKDYEKLQQKYEQASHGSTRLMAIVAATALAIGLGGGVVGTKLISPSSSQPTPVVIQPGNDSSK